MSDPRRASLSKQLVNQDTQTVTSPFIQQELFNFKKDQLKLKQQESLYKFQYSRENVEQLVSAINWKDETIRNKGRIIRASRRRFQSLIQSLKDQIETNSQYARTRREQKLIIEQLIRSLAYAIDPASRHGRNLSKGNKEPLFSHQKYEHSMKYGSALFVHPVPVNLSNSDLSEEDETQEFELIYSYDSIMYLTNDTNLLKISNIEPENLVVGKQIQIFNQKKLIGSVTIQEYQQSNEEEEQNDLKSMPPNFHVIEPITAATRTSFLIHVLNGSDLNRMNLKLLVNPYDFSFIDVMLSIPRLSFDEIRDLIIFMYKENYLSAYINSKLCQFLYYSRTRLNQKDSNGKIEASQEENGKTHIRVNVKTNSFSKLQRSREWPDLLGRLIALLDHQWFIDMAQQMENLDLPQVIKNIVKKEDNTSKKSQKQTTYLNPLTEYVLGIILDEFQCQERGDTSEFLWEFLCKSVFANLYMSKSEADQKMKHKLEALYLGTKEKPHSSKTRINTQKVVNTLIDISKNKSFESVFNDLMNVDTSTPKLNSTYLKKFSSQDFLMKAINNHQDEILHILRNIPYTTEEASPLFFPIILEVRDALYALEQGEEMAVASTTNESPIVSDVLIEEEEKVTIKKTKVAKKQQKRAKSCKTEIKEKTITKIKKQGKGKTPTKQKQKTKEATTTKPKQAKEAVITKPQQQNEPAIPEYQQMQLSSDDLEYNLIGSKHTKRRSSSASSAQLNTKQKGKAKKTAKRPAKKNKGKKLQLDSGDEN